MDITEAIGQRKSIRAFKSDAVPKETLIKIMELALRAPSWANTQPWEFAIVGGETLEEIRKAFAERAKAGEQMNPDLAAPFNFPEPYDSRRRALGGKLFEIMEIKREDKEKLRLFSLQGSRFFEAPNLIYIYTDRSFYSHDDNLNVWPVFDCGLVAENIMLLATKYGLGTIPQARAVAHPDALRRILRLPDTKLIIIGISIGYPDWDASANKLRSERDSLDNVATWYGFD